MHEDEYLLRRRHSYVRLGILGTLLGLLALLVLVVVGILVQDQKSDVLTIKINEAFSGFVANHNKQYNTKEEKELRRAIFEENYKLIEDYNAQNNTFQLGLNQFADLTEEEYSRMYLGPSEPINSTVFSDPEVNDQSCPNITSTEPFLAESSPQGLKTEESRDWVYEGKVAPIRNQGQCGGCWAFAAISATESLYAIKTKSSPIYFSEQALIDCSHEQGSQGCKGGSLEGAFEHLIKKGATLLSDYPYKGEDGNCQTNVNKYMQLQSMHKYHAGDSENVRKGVLSRPVAIVLNAKSKAFRFYKSGILTEDCPNNVVNHGVVIVGVGERNDIPYWRVRNSWGTEWGDQGYIYIKRYTTTDIGLCAMLAYPIIPLYDDKT